MWASALLATVFAVNSWTVFQFSFWPDVQLYDDDTDVIGLRLALGMSLNETVTGFDLGLANVAKTLNGLQIGVLNLAFALWSDTTVNGLQVGVVNATKTLHGVQLGGYNETQYGGGVQIGLVNTGFDFTGVQIGLLNFNSRSPLPFFPFVNARF